MIDMNDGYVFFGSASQILPVDAAFANQPVPNTGGGSPAVPSGENIVVGLYVGLAAGTGSDGLTGLTLVTAVSINSNAISAASDGQIDTTTVQLPTGFPGGVKLYMNLAAWSSGTNYQTQGKRIKIEY